MDSYDPTELDRIMARFSGVDDNTDPTDSTPDPIDDGEENELPTDDPTDLPPVPDEAESEDDPTPLTHTLSDEEYAAYQRYIQSSTTPAPIANPEPIAPTYIPPTFDIDDYTDPVLRQVAEYVRILDERAHASEQLLVAQQAAIIQNEVVEGAQAFKAQYSLDDSTFARVYNDPTVNNIYSTLINSGTPYRDAVSQALEFGLFKDPTYRQQANRSSTSRSASTKSRQQKLSGLSSNGSTTPAPSPELDGMTPLERAVAEAMMENN